MINRNVSFESRFNFKDTSESDITSVYKKKDPTLVKNYRPVSVLRIYSHCAQNSKLWKNIYLHFRMSYGSQ